MFLATNPDCSGIYNVVAPDPSTNAQIAEELGRMLHRPTLLRVPASVLHAALGDQSNELLSSIRAQPTRLLAAGFEFEHPTLNTQIADALT